MANLVLTDAKILAGAYDFSGVANEIQLSFNAEMLNVTTFGGSTQKFRPGLFGVEASGKGFADTEDVGPSIWTDVVLFGQLGSTAVPLSVAPVGTAEGDRVYSFKGVSGSYTPVGGSVGSMLEFNIDMKAGGSQLVQGQLMASGAKTTTGNSTGFQRGAVAAAKKIYGALHVTAYTGITSIDVVIESAAANTFIGPTTRLTFAQKTAIGWDWQEATPGVVTDTWWRAKWTIAGAGSATIFVVLGVQP